MNKVSNFSEKLKAYNSLVFRQAFSKHFQKSAVKFWLKIMKINKTCDHGDSEPKKYQNPNKPQKLTYNPKQTPKIIFKIKNLKNP